MPLHPTIVALPLALALLLATLDGARLATAIPRRLALGAHVLLVAACLIAVLSGQSEKGRQSMDATARAAAATHESWATTVTFVAGGALLARLASWRSRHPRRDAALAFLSCGLLAALLVTSRLGGHLVFEHGLGVAKATSAAGQ